MRYTEKILFLVLRIFSSWLKNGNEDLYPFRIGVSTSSYQIESAENRGPTIWDTFDGVLNNDAVSDGPMHDYYYVEDIDIIDDIGFRDYRLSFSWSRFYSTDMSRIDSGGVVFYKNIIRELRDRGIEPCVTLFHWDLPLSFQEDGDIRGFETMNIAPYFLEYSELVFRNFHEDVKCWITINEPFTYVHNGYVTGSFAPGVRNDTLADIVFKNMMHIHALTYKLFHSRFGDGEVSISLNSDWVSSINDTKRDEVLMHRFGRYADTLFPESGRPLVDFFALNHYTTMFLDDSSENKHMRFPITSSSSWLYFHPPGFGLLLDWIDDRYSLTEKNMSMRITENGWSSPNILEDNDRIMYLRNYMMQAKNSGINITHYYVWSLMDNFEWASGFSERFGIVYINFTSPYKERALKLSAKWLKQLIANY